MNSVLSETHCFFSISLIPNGKFLRVVAKSLSMVRQNISEHSAIFNSVEFLVFMSEIISMSLEEKEVLFTRITWGEL